MEKNKSEGLMLEISERIEKSESLQIGVLLSAPCQLHLAHSTCTRTRWALDNKNHSSSGDITN